MNKGRMVKFNARQVSDTEWSFPERTDIEYQSWVRVYPDYKALRNAVK